MLYHILPITYKSTPNIPYHHEKQVKYVKRKRVSNCY